MTIVQLAIVNDTTIVVGDTRVTPAATHLFALLLVLALSTDRPRTRSELQALLFSDDVDPRDASHNLRQLLYRLRSLGVVLDERAAGECLDGNCVEGAVSGLMLLASEKRALLDRAALVILPGYRPQLTPAFTCWLDAAKDRVEGKLRDILLDDFRSLRQAHQWRHVAALGATLQILDPWREELVSGRAEALAMLGRKDDAIDAIERFSRSVEADPDVATSMRRLKARVSRTHVPKRQSTLRGREDCLALLRTQWEEAREGGARLVAVLGPAGMGKTRVAEEFSTRIRLSRGIVLQHRCDELSRAYPLALFTRLLPQLRSLRGSIGASPLYGHALDRMLPTIGATAMDIPEGASAEALRADIQLGLVDLFEAVSAEQQLLLLIDDAHLLDEASAAVLRLFTSADNSAAAMILACSRTREDALNFLGDSKRSSSHILAPLVEEHVRAIILELSDSAELTESDLSWGVQQAAGNPYFAQTLGVSAIKDRSTPVSVSALASTAYFALSAASRTTLEATLILGQFATLHRLERLLQWGVFATLTSLRELEARDLISFSDGLLECPHSLFCEAIRKLIPSTVAASLHRHIARLLEEELPEASVSPDAALAAAKCWVAAGDIEAAVSLTRRCARTAASLGEPAAAVFLLSDLLHARMPAISRKWILGDLILYASDSGDRAVLLTALSERVEIAEREKEDSVVIRTLRLRIIQAEIAAGKKLDGVSTELRSLLTADNLPASVRVEAGVFLMIAADMDLDRELGEEVFVALLPLISGVSESDPLRIRAELVYHTSFGDVTRARELVARVQSDFPSPSVDKFIDETRHFAAFSLLRIGLYAEARAMCELDFDFMRMRGVWSKAERSAALLAEIAVAEGCMDNGEHWLKEAYSCAHRGQPRGAVFSHGCVSSAAAIAIHHRRYRDARTSVTEAKRDLSLLSSRRFLGVLTAQELRIAQLGGDSATAEQVLSLRELYRLGRCAGGQDTTVEALWVVESGRGDGDAAHDLLHQYLSVDRREVGDPEWSLRNTTAEDTAWRP